MQYLVLFLLIGVIWSVPASAEGKTLSNSVLNEKGYKRLDGKSQYRLGCRYLVRSEDRSTVYRPTVVRGGALSFTHAGIAYNVTAGEKSRLKGSDGSVQRVTTWRTCAWL